MIPLTAPVALVLDDIRREPGNPWVIIGKTPGSCMSSVKHDWHRIRAQAGLDDVRLHDCRHYSRIRLIPGRFTHRCRELSTLQNVA